MSQHQDCINFMQTLLTESFQPTQLEIIDESHKHIGHAGAANGQGHFWIKIVSDMFNNVPLVQRHRLIYDTLSQVMNSRVHALRINAKSPKEIAFSYNNALDAH